MSNRRGIGYELVGQVFNPPNPAVDWMVFEDPSDTRFRVDTLTLGSVMDEKLKEALKPYVSTVESAFSDRVPADKDAMMPGGQMAAVSMLGPALKGEGTAMWATEALAPFSDISAALADRVCNASPIADVLARHDVQSYNARMKREASRAAQDAALSRLLLPAIQGEAQFERDLASATPAQREAARRMLANPPVYGCGDPSSGPVSFVPEFEMPIYTTDGTPVGPMGPAAVGIVNMEEYTRRLGMNSIEQASVSAVLTTQDQIQNVIMGLHPDTVIMGKVPPSPYTPRALVSNVPPEMQDPMELEARVARSAPYAWATWPETMPLWARDNLSVSADGHHLMYVHPSLPTATPIVPNSNGVGPTLAKLVTNFTGSTLDNAYGTPFPLRYDMYPQYAPVTVPTRK